VSDVPVVDDNWEATGTLAGLAQVREQVVELLAWLERPPRSLRVEAGAVTLDIVWDVETAAPSAVRPVAAAATETGAAAETGAGTAADAVHLRSPTVGVFYPTPEPGAAPFVSVGSEVRIGQQIGIIEAMKLMMPVEADRAGVVTAVLKGHGEPVEFDEPLFTIDAAEEG
jgi:acetyl-CoA carboxylase biotin carboxyl carrier protein